MKIIVTEENLTKISETTLVNVLNTLDNTCPTAMMIEAELDRRAEVLTANKEKSKVKRAEDEAIFIRLKSEVSALFVSLQKGKIAKLVEAFGDEFAGDYTVNLRTFTIESHVANAFQKDAGKWDHESEEEALRHFQRLLYHRIYDKHMRSATIDSLSKLKLALEKI